MDDTLDDARWDAVFAYLDRKERYEHLKTLCARYPFLFSQPLMVEQMQAHELQALYGALKRYDQAYRELVHFGTFNEGVFTNGVSSGLLRQLHRFGGIVRTPTHKIGSLLQGKVQESTAKKVQHTLEAIALVAGGGVAYSFGGKNALLGFVGGASVTVASSVAYARLRTSQIDLQEAREEITLLQNRYVN